MNIEEIVSNYSMNTGTMQMQKPKMYSSNNLEELTSIPQYMDLLKSENKLSKNGTIENVYNVPGENTTVKEYYKFNETGLDSTAIGAQGFGVSHNKQFKSGFTDCGDSNHP